MFVLVSNVQCQTAATLVQRLTDHANKRLPELTVQPRFFKDLKKIEQIDAKGHFFVFIVSSYASGKKCRSIRRFQRKLENFSGADLEKMQFCVLSVDAKVAENEGAKMRSALLSHKCSSFYADGMLTYEDAEFDGHIDSLLSALQSLLPNNQPKEATPPELEHKESSCSVDGTPTALMTPAFDFSIAFGTQSGNAKQIANEIVELALSENAQYAIDGPMDLNALDWSRLRRCEHLIIVISTTGDGEVPDNADLFYRKLKLKLHALDGASDAMPLEGVKYAVLGLGDSNYSRFNQAAKHVDAVLAGLGAQKFYRTGYADDGIGLEEEVEPWKHGLIGELQRRLRTLFTLPPTPRSTSRVRSLSASTSTSASASASGATISAQPDEGPASTPTPSPRPSNSIALSPTKHTPYSTHKHTLFASPPTNKSAPTASPFSLKFRLARGVIADADASSAESASAHVPRRARHELFATNDANGAGGGANATSFRAYDASKPFLAELVSATRQAACADRTVVHLTLRLPNGYGYEIGDVLCVFPPNPEWLVQALLARLALDGAERVRVQSIIPFMANPLPHIPFAREVAVAEILRFCVDVVNLPSSASFFKSLAACCEDDADAQRLLAMSPCRQSKHKDKRAPSLLELLETYASCRPSLECLLHFLSPLKCRQYSICSAPSRQPDSVDICFRVFENGLCSSFLYSLCCHQAQLLDVDASATQSNIRRYEYGFVQGADSGAGRKVQIACYLKLSPSFTPPSSSTPMLLIGPGTGVSVFRAFLQHRSEQRKVEQHRMCHGLWRGIDMQFGDDDLDAEGELDELDEGEGQDSERHGARCVLFFGCRHPHKDHLFKQDWRRFEEDGVLDEMFVAYSRYYDKKVYVQHLLHEQSAMVARMILGASCHVFVCGDAAKMARDVENTLIEVIALHSKMSLAESTKYVDNMKLARRYHIDVWSS